LWFCRRVGAKQSEGNIQKLDTVRPTLFIAMNAEEPSHLQ